MAKYEALAEYVRQQTLREFELPFYKIEAIIESKLPESFPGQRVKTGEV